MRPCQGRSRGFKSRLPLHNFCPHWPLALTRVHAVWASASGRFNSGRGTQVVRERSAKPLCVGSIPTRTSSPKLTYQRSSVGCAQTSKFKLESRQAHFHAFPISDDPACDATWRPDPPLFIRQSTRGRNAGIVQGQGQKVSPGKVSP